MNRRTIPAIGMIHHGQEHLRREGFVALPLAESMVIDPQRGRPHYHDFFQVTLLTGKGRLMHDFRETDISGTTIFFLSPGQVHTAGPAPETVATVVSFTREFFEAHSEGTGLLPDLPFFFATETMPWLALQPEEATVAQQLFREIQAEFDAAEPGASEILRSLLRILFVRASRWYVRAHPASRTTRSSVLVREFQLAIEQHVHEWQALEPYARKLGVTANHLNDVMREETGQAAGEYIRLRRLLDAKRLLLHSDLSVSEIGYRLGFKDPSYFSRFFRRYEEATPAEFREQIREKYQH